MTWIHELHLEGASKKPTIFFGTTTSCVDASAWSSTLDFLEGTSSSSWVSLSARALLPLFDLGLGAETAAAADAGLATDGRAVDLVVLAEAGFAVVASAVVFFLGGMVGGEKRG